METNYLSVLGDCTLRGNTILLPTYQVPAEIFPKVKRTLEGLGGTWSRQLKAYVFKQSPEPHWPQVLKGEQINLVRQKRKKTQFFPTPQPVIDAMLEYICIGTGHRVLEPSAGQGDICARLLSEFEGSQPWTLDVCELDTDNRDYLIDQGYQVIAEDFLQLPKPPRGYHFIVANPPFAGLQDILHVQHMYECLAPGGRIVSIMSTTWHEGNASANEPLAKEFRHWLGCFFHGIDDLPKGSFRASGTEVKTCLLCLDKPLDDAY